MRLFNRSVATITASLHTMVKQLEEHAKAKHYEAVAAQAHATAAAAEVLAAERVRERLSSILNPTT